MGETWPRPLRALYLSRNFTARELACRCCGLLLVTDLLGELVQCLQRLRDLVGRPVQVTSGCRCLKHNTEVGGKPNSWHPKSGAADLRVAGMTPAELAPLARQAGFREVVVEGHGKTGWLHAAVRD